MDYSETVSKWQKARASAEARPAMYISDPAKAHQLAIYNVLRLVWQAKVFRLPKAVYIDLSPTQYIVRVHAGPLIRPIQQIFSFGGHETLFEPWQEEGRAYIEKIDREDKERDIERRKWRSRHGWRYSFSGPTGPRLSSPSYPLFLAHRLSWAIRTDKGLWFEAYEHGQPLGRPELLQEPSAVALFVAATLDPKWFTGLPFTPEDARTFRNMSGKQAAQDVRWDQGPHWKCGEIIVDWHTEATIAGDDVLTSEGIAKWLQ